MTRGVGEVERFFNSIKTSRHTLRDWAAHPGRRRNMNRSVVKRELTDLILNISGKSTAVKLKFAYFLVMRPPLMNVP